jgi:hypothetical protein
VLAEHHMSCLTEDFIAVTRGRCPNLMSREWLRRLCLQLA